ncbi:hypothetical protein BN903_57 [Halorubrum sp. AJ67]|nr:hypothetical protein BN903_57 [Halorubrum sp. AJ67]
MRQNSDFVEISNGALCRTQTDRRVTRLLARASNLIYPSVALLKSHSSDTFSSETAGR